MRIALAALLVSVPALAFAAGGDDKPTKTGSDSCKGGEVWDKAVKKCVAPKESSLDDDGLYGVVREFAYAGRYDDAITVLDAMSDQADDRVLTYRGFTARKLGQIELANLYYRDAIEANPDNILARSYMAQGFVEQGDMVAAVSELREIQARGGTGSWAERALRDAIETGRTYSY